MTTVEAESPETPHPSKLLTPARAGLFDSAAPYLVAAIGLLLTVVTWFLSEGSRRMAADARFEELSAGIQSQVEGRLEQYEDVLVQSRGLFMANPEVTHSEFRTYIDGIRFQTSFRGVSSLGFVPRVPAQNVDAHLKNTWQAGYTQYRIWPAAPASLTRFPVLFVEPFNSLNQEALGFALETEPAYRTAMNEARDRGQPQTSAKTPFPADAPDRGGSGFLMFAPVYRSDAKKPLRTPAERQRDLTGFVFAAFQPRPLFDAVFPAGPPNQLAVQIFDGAVATPESELFSSQNTPSDFHPLYDRWRNINVAGHTWRLRTASLPAFERAADAGRSGTVLVIGIIVSLLIFWFMRSSRQLAEIERDLMQQSRKLLFREQSARREAEEALRARGEFMSIASHELKTPLTSLKLQLQMLARAPELGRWRRLLTSSDRQVSALNRLVDDLLDLTRIQNGRFTLSRELCDLTELVREVAERLSQQLSASHCDLFIDADPGVCGIWDRYRLEQVVTNLVTNAIKYGQGQPIHITVSRIAGHAVLAVRDFGMGIPPELHDKIFERFERASVGRGSVARIAGLGLGLYIVKRILAAHGGTIRVDSSVGAGATFTVALDCLPAQPQPAAPTTEASASDPSSGTPGLRRESGSLSSASDEDSSERQPS